MAFQPFLNLKICENIYNVETMKNNITTAEIVKTMYTKESLKKSLSYNNPTFEKKISIIDEGRTKTWLLEATFSIFLSLQKKKLKHLLGTFMTFARKINKT